ncbi:hypothetical protein XfCFBP8082_05065 [Xylella fastidiosa subsp. fastidiosa]|uniref:hypothetical protein n=1 Tax=Xylella fastidiosa TaxID=2371 RepID=UPI00052B5268|nr:hypothetical protein [Xylella fastidiosa]KAF0571867.1 hypothetical protein P305_08705 [Xylella fastidiosa subsp. fastidiosa Mus-1]KGM21585.1 hypothetical protein JT24_01685 [Xylella fastidiosa]MDC7963094.1 hypothetical protein [Xylella fastidiosa]NBI38029.1 hypothetical protein [Xylella fastidiosa subsp. fastidiosa]NMR13137.1 hypothetical protein [Xylella fastidiosa]
MPFINEIPSAEDIEKYGLPYKKQLNLDISLRSQWTVDRERNFHLYGGGTANQAYEEIFYYRFYMYLNGTKFVVELDVDRNRIPSMFKDNPYVVEWSKLMSIKVWHHDQVSPLKRVPPAAWDTPDAPQPLLDNRSLNQFIAILKEALTVHGAGDSNRRIHHPIVVHFGF